MKYTIVIPAYNSEKFILRPLESLKKQEYKNLEIIVVNDASTDNSAEIARKHTDNVINIEHSGPVIARNIGLKHAHGEYVIFMDSDDVFVQNAIQNMKNEIKDNDGIIGLRQDFISPDCGDIITEIKKSSHGVIAGCAMFKKSVFDIVGLY